MLRTKRTVRVAVIIVVLSLVTTGCTAFIDFHQLRVIRAQETA